MEQLPIECKCGKTFSESKFKSHFSNCTSFKIYFRRFDLTLGELLKSFSEPKENLKIIRFLLKQYIGVLDKKISTNFPLPAANQSNNQPSHHLKNSSKINNSSIQLNNQSGIHLSQVNDGLIDTQDTCQRCKSSDYNYLECCHPMCIKCFVLYAENDFPNMKCKCGNIIKENYKKYALGEQRYNELDNKFSFMGIGPLVECPSCHEKNSFEPGNVDYKIKDEKNQPVSREACEHYAKNRIRCPRCKNNFCAQCKIIPYHLGKTCQEVAKFIKAIKCRYCNTEITNQNRGRELDVCNAEDCAQRYKLACKKNFLVDIVALDVYLILNALLAYFPHVLVTKSYSIKTLIHTAIYASLRDLVVHL